MNEYFILFLIALILCLQPFFAYLNARAEMAGWFDEYQSKRKQKRSKHNAEKNEEEV